MRAVCHNSKQWDKHSSCNPSALGDTTGWSWGLTLR